MLYGRIEWFQGGSRTKAGRVSYAVKVYPSTAKQVAMVHHNAVVGIRIQYDARPAMRVWWVCSMWDFRGLHFWHKIGGWYIDSPAGAQQRIYFAPCGEHIIERDSEIPLVIIEELDQLGVVKYLHDRWVDVFQWRRPLFVVFGHV